WQATARFTEELSPGGGGRHTAFAAQDGQHLFLIYCQRTGGGKLYPRTWQGPSLRTERFESTERTASGIDAALLRPGGRDSSNRRIGNLRGRARDHQHRAVLSP